MIDERARKMIDNQMRFEDIDDGYREFVEKFKPKKTTDDCYTPDAVYDVVAKYVTDRYGIRREDMVRPFWPGGDYKRYPYPVGGVVVDNPPFSIIGQIVKDYNAAGVKFFMFSPYLTCMGIRNCTKIVTDADVTYANGATVNTCFVTNMEPGIIARSDPDLKEAIDKAVKEKSTAKKLPKYKYPKYVVTATMLGYLSVYGVKWELKEEDGYFIRSLDSQRAVGKSIFGSGYLISEQAAAEKAAAEKAAAEKAAAEKVDCIEWKLSQNERDIIEDLTRKRKNHDGFFDAGR